MTSAADDDGWLNLAIHDDTAVVDVLLRLKLALPRRLPVSLRWTVRQPRSKNVPRQQSVSSDVAVVAAAAAVDVEAKSNHKKKKGESSSGARASPTTPLSWSGATSVSGGGGGGATSVSGGGGGGAIDGCSEESSKPSKPTDAARSKVAVRSETAIFKRPRKKKTLAELKEEESLLLKERRNLKNELATLHLTVEKHRATNESLKKMKLDLKLPLTTVKATTSSVVSGQAIWQQHEQVNVVGDPTRVMPTSVHCNILGASQSSCAPNVSCKVEELVNQGAAFSLPDLNIPFGDDPTSEVIYGMS